MKILFLRDRTSTTASTASNLTIITTGNQCLISLCYSRSSGAFGIFSFTGTAFLVVVEEESFFKRQSLPRAENNQAIRS